MDLARYISKARAFLLTCAAVIASCPAAVAQTYVSSQVERALITAHDQAAKNQFYAALNTLGRLGHVDQQNYSVQLLRGRILSWAGHYDHAEAEFEDMLAKTPNNPDVLLAYGYLDYYRGDNVAAQAKFLSILNAYPDYEDANLALNRVSFEAEADKNLQLDFGGAISTFSRSANENWSQVFIQGVKKGKTGTWSMRFDRYDRFSLTDEEITVGYSRRFESGWDMALNASVVPSADFRPDAGASITLGHSTKIQAAGVEALRVKARLKSDFYGSNNITSVDPGLEVYLTPGPVLSGSLISVKSETEDWEFGGVTQVSLPVLDDLTVVGGLANAPEAINGEVIRTQSVFGYMAYKLNPDLTVRASFARDDRSNSYIRENFGLSVSRLF